MTHGNTPEKAKGMFDGEKLYQKRARRALPILVRRAQIREPMTYGDLAFELGMPNPRNCNYVLGCIGVTLLDLNDQSPGLNAPPIETIVVGKDTGQPGGGVDHFLDSGTVDAPRDDRVRIEHDKVFQFDRWGEVLEKLGLSPIEGPIDLGTFEIGKKSSDGMIYVSREGRKCAERHCYIERSPSLSRSKKQLTIAQTGELRCEVCRMTFTETYGPELGADFIECHHITPLSALKGKSQETSLDDLALVCANCHRMLHRMGPEEMSPKNLRKSLQQ